jgi:DNA polymerase V
MPRYFFAVEKTNVFFFRESAFIVSGGKKTDMYRIQSGTPSSMAIPLVEENVAAGFPSPAEGLVERQLDLNEALIQNPVATFFVRVSGESMVGAGIYRGDLLVVDRSIEAQDRHIIIARLDSEYMVKRLRFSRKSVYLVSENPDFPPVEITGSPVEFEIWGVVTTVIRSLLCPI